MSERCEGNFQDEEVSKRCSFFLIGTCYFSEGWSWRKREDKVEIFLTEGKIFSVKGTLWSLFWGLKEKWECALDASTDATNEVLEFLDAEVSSFSDGGFDAFLFS